MKPETSPDGTLLVEYGGHEMRMSHWVFPPRVTHVPTGEVLFDLWGAETSLWDGHARFPEPGIVELTLRHYPDGNETWRVRIDADARTYAFLAGAPEPVLASRLRERLRPVAPGSD
ncbi:MAG: hypothetical protein JRI25_28870 [Deltaproteobacteria bacterium]|nr:hypothetical protein [Deltaproteobacteria bacterium]